MKKFLLVFAVLPFAAQAQTSMTTATAKLTTQQIIESKALAGKTISTKNIETEKKTANTNPDQVKNMFGWVTWKYSSCKKAPVTPSVKFDAVPIVVAGEPSKKRGKVKS